MPSTTPRATPDDWITLKPSQVSLVLTLVLALGSAGVVLVMTLSPTATTALLVAVLVVTLFDVWLVRQHHATAVVAFAVSSTSASRSTLDASAESALLFEPESSLEYAANVPRDLFICVHYRGDDKNALREPIAVTGKLTRQSYVSVYFTSIGYVLDSDPTWRRWFPRVLAIWPDAVDRDAFRKLRVQLKWR
jgi:hypothetical protein